MLRTFCRIISLKKLIGKDAMEIFVWEYLMENSTIDFYRPIKNMKLKALSFITKLPKSVSKIGLYL